MTRAIRRLWWHLLWRTEEQHQALRVGSTLYVSPATAAILRAQLAPAQSLIELPKVGDFEVIETPYMARFVTVPRFPRLAALARRLS